MPIIASISARRVPGKRIASKISAVA